MCSCVGRLQKDRHEHICKHQKRGEAGARPLSTVKERPCILHASTKKGGAVYVGRKKEKETEVLTRYFARKIEPSKREGRKKGKQKRESTIL